MESAEVVKSNGDCLPSALWMHILSVLPVKSLLNVRVVCKFLHAITNDAYFMSLHLRNFPANRHEARILTLRPLCSPMNAPKGTICEVLEAENSLSNAEVFLETENAELNPNPGVSSHSRWIEAEPGTIFQHANGSAGYGQWRVSGSVYGLLLVIAHNEAILWNPSIRRSRKLRAPSNSISSFNSMRLGLGYDTSCDDYKALAIIDHTFLPDPNLMSNTIEAASGAWVYSVKTDSWKTIELPTCRDKREKSESLSFNGGLVWIEGVDTGRSYYHHLVWFNFATEKFCYTPMPYPIKNNLWVQSRFVMIDGGSSLGVWGLDLDSFVSIWAMDVSNLSWTRLYNVGEGVLGMGVFRSREMIWEYYCTKGARPSLYIDMRERNYQTLTEYVGVYFESLVLN